MSDEIDLRTASPILGAMVRVIVANADRLNTLDGAIGDGDHVVNMSKGFRRAGQKLEAGSKSLGDGFGVLAETLLDEIGGSMGPLYGSFFLDMSTFLRGRATLDRHGFAAMLRAGVSAVMDLGDGHPGDKSLVDVLVPALAAFEAEAARDGTFSACLDAMDEAAGQGLEATRDMVAKIGRASRLGERSRGHLDAGATSCRLLLCELAEGLRAQLGS